MTIKDVARRSGYAVGTVSRVLNGHPDVSEEARRRVLAAVAETGFKPNNNARNLKQRRSESVAIMVKGAGNLFFADVLERLQSLIKGHGRAAAVYYLDEDDNEVEQAIGVCRELKPAGILFLGGNRENFQAGFGQVKCPCVLLSTRADSLGFENLSSVSTDDVAGSEQAMEFLLDMGHRRIGVIGGMNCVESPEQGCNTSQLRLMGCVRACRKRGVPFHPAEQTVEYRYSMEGGYEGASELLDRGGGITALFAMCDVMAIGAMRAIRDRGLRVPEDVSVIGYDGILQSDYAVPRLSTVRQGAEQIARRGVEILLAQMEGGGSVHEIVPFTLSTGESVHRLEEGRILA